MWITITAEVDGVKGDCTTTFGRYGKSDEVVGYACIREEKDAERFSAPVEALTGKRPRAYRMEGGTMMVVCYEGRPEGYALCGAPRGYGEMA
ncbi:MAG: hypothetical protein RXR02_02690 [Thermoproteus sp.]|nr:MAG: hypothetical protein AT711_04040 [Thermoproteus sp. CIS_19]